MKVLHKIYGCVLGLALLSLPTFFFDSFSLNWFSVYFYQVLVVSGILTTTYFLSKLFTLKFRWGLFLLLFVEVSFYSCLLSLKNGVIFPEFLQAKFQYFYKNSMRDTPQFNPDLAQYDEKLFYRLQPGNHHFNNFEFETDFNVNSLGTRDNETSLVNPKVVAIGDSFTMGWGVQQEDTFVSLIEGTTSYKVLNAGISSYGTAREYLLLNEVNLDSCKVILLQFCSNDILENRTFVENDFELNISPLQSYQATLRENYLRSTYFPFKFSFGILKKIVLHFTKLHPENIDAISVGDIAYLTDFFKIVHLIQEKFQGKIIIFNLESTSTTNKNFKDFQAYLNKDPNENLLLFDASSVLKESDYFNLDDHINSRGHKNLANGILKIIAKNQLLD